MQMIPWPMALLREPWGNNGEVVGEEEQRGSKVRSKVGRKVGRKVGSEE